MRKDTVLLPLEIFVKKIIFPLSRWHNSNLFLYTRKDLCLKDKPTIFWLIFGRFYMYFQRLINKCQLFYSEAVVDNYSILIKKHYLGNYAYDNDILSSDDYQNRFKTGRGTLSELFENKFLVKISNINDNDSFLDCGCGIGLNIKEIFSYFPNAKVIAFDISQNAIDFAKKMIKEKDVEFFQGSVMDMNIFKRYKDNSIDNILFANMFSTILSNGIERTRKMRKEILMEAVRIAKKNVIINEKYSSGTKIFIEQKYRAIFYEDYSAYFEEVKGEGDILLTPKLTIFHKGRKP